jgi:hypothetical protein
METTKLTSYDDTGTVIGDSIEMYDAGDWTTYYYVNQPASNENWGEGYENVWIGAESFVAENVSEDIPVGKGFWYRAKSAGTTMNIIAQE